MPVKMRRLPPICVLTIAGSDSGGGAGIQADSRTIHALGGFAATAITAVTAQSTRGVSAWNAVTPKLIADQVEIVCRDLPVAAVKTGLLPGVTAVVAVARSVSLFPKTPLVVDPVIGSTSGTRFLPPAGVRAMMMHLLPRATVVTPNWSEAATLSGRPVSRFADAEEAAKTILERAGCRAVLVKGGHGAGRTCEDLLLLKSGERFVFTHRRIESANTHGTGCTLSAAIATRLAFGDSIRDAVEVAVEFLQRALSYGRRVDWGDGHGPAFSGRPAKAALKSPNR